MVLGSLNIYLRYPPSTITHPHHPSITRTASMLIHAQSIIHHPSKPNIQARQRRADRSGKYLIISRISDIIHPTCGNKQGVINSSQGINFIKLVFEWAICN
jgi:hypothetical protein